MAIHGSGYAVSSLAEVAWLAETPLLYWGDLDSNGFAILNQLRSHLPHVVSLLMDEETLASHEKYCVIEPSPNLGNLSMLTPHEQATLNLLLQGQNDKALRLEQEHIDWAYALEKIKEVHRVILG